MIPAGAIQRAGDLAGRAAALVAASWKWLAFSAAIGALCFVQGCRHGLDQAKVDRVAEERAARSLADQSAGAAAAERNDDRFIIEYAQEARDHAIEAANSTGKPSAASNNLNCQRLFDAGQDLSLFPACRGYQGRGQAASNR